MTRELGAFAAVEGLVMVGVTQGLRFHLGWYLLAAFGLGALYTLLGLLLVAKHTSITEFLVPNGIVLGMLVPLPLLPYLGVWESPWWLLFPTQPQLILFTAAFEPVAPWRLVYAVLGSVWTCPTLADDRVQAFAYAKIFSAVTSLPVFALFLDPPWRYLTGIFPGTWNVLALRAAQRGEPWFLLLALGGVTGWLALAWMVVYFQKTVARS